MTGGSLSARLEAIAARVLPGRPMADVGTDHALLPVALVRRGIVPKAIGIDVAPAPLARARPVAAGVAGVELRLGDGLTPLKPGEVATVVVAGMGGARIVELLDAFEPLASLTRLVLSPNTQWPRVRRFIAARELRLREEVLVEDRGHAYLVLSVDPSVREASPWDEDDLLLGPRLLRERPDAWQRWVRAEHARLDAARRRAPADDPIHDRCARFAAARHGLDHEPQGSEMLSTPSPPTDRRRA